MPTVTLTRDGSAPARATLPSRLRLSRAETERLAAATGTPLPWQPATEPATEPADVSAHPDGAAALAVFGRPEVFVDLSLALTRDGRVDQLDAWHRLAGGRVTTLAATGGDCELAWYDVRWWHPALTALVARPRPDAARPSPRPGLVLPLELLLASGDAHRTGRQDVLAELLARYGGAVADERGRLGEVDAREELRTLHAGVQGRLRVVVTSPEPRTLGLVSWLLFADGWHELEPRRTGGPPLVAFPPVPPSALGARVARLVTAVRP